MVWYFHLFQNFPVYCDPHSQRLIAKLRLKLKKVGKTTRPFRYDLNQIPYDYTVDVRNRFKGLDLIDRVPDELWMEVPDTVEETGIKTIPNDFRAQAEEIGHCFYLFPFYLPCSDGTGCHDLSFFNIEI